MIVFMLEKASRGIRVKQLRRTSGAAVEIRWQERKASGSHQKTGREGR